MKKEQKGRSKIIQKMKNGNMIDTDFYVDLKIHFRLQNGLINLFNAKMV